LDRDVVMLRADVTESWPMDLREVGKLQLSDVEEMTELGGMWARSCFVPFPVADDEGLDALPLSIALKLQWFSHAFATDPQWKRVAKWDAASRFFF
jgi:hypothetical protein